MKTNGKELVIITTSMVRVGNSFKHQCSYKFIGKIDSEDIIIDSYNGDALIDLIVLMTTFLFTYC